MSNKKLQFARKRRRWSPLSGMSCHSERYTEVKFIEGFLFDNVRTNSQLGAKTINGNRTSDMTCHRDVKAQLLQKIICKKAWFTSYY
jgi:hypothetical protein